MTPDPLSRRNVLRLTGATLAAVSSGGTAMAQLTGDADYEDVAMLIGPYSDRPTPAEFDYYEEGHWIYWVTDDSGRYEITEADSGWSVIPGTRQRVINTLTEEVTVSNTMAEETVFEATIEADHFMEGDRYELPLEGAYTTVNNSETFTLRFYLGDVVLASVTSVADNADTYPWDATLKFTVRHIDGDGIMQPHVDATFNNTPDDQHPGTVVLDTTIPETFSVTIEWGEANAGNEVRIGQAMLERVGTA